MKNKLLIVIALFVLSYSNPIIAQIDNTMFFMDRLPQANYLNTSTVPECKFFMGGLLVPILGELPPPITIAVNTPFDWNDFVFHGRWEYADSLISPLHPNADLSDFLKKLKKENYFTTDLQISYLYFGFKQDKNFWTFDASNRTNFQFGLPGNVLKFFILGNGELRDADFTGLHMNFMNYNQIAIGYKRQVTRYFSVGIRAKYLSGVANYYTSSSNITFRTADQTNWITSSSNYVVHTNAISDVTLNDKGFVEEINFINFDKNNMKEEIKKNVFFTGNRGIAIDAGLSKDWNSEGTFFINIEDLGFINWKEHPNTFSLVGDESNNGGFEYKGIELNNFDFKNIDILPNMDTLINKFDFEYSNKSYKTPLPFKIYGGIRYKITPKFYAGLLGRYEKLTFGSRPSATVTANYRPGKFGLLTLSYSYINRNFNNIGLGTTLRLGPIQWYFVSDNIIGTVLFPDKSRSCSIRMGCNFILGYKGKEKPQKALPMFNNNNNATNRKIPKFGQINKPSILKKDNKRFRSISAPSN